CSGHIKLIAASDLSRLSMSLCHGRRFLGLTELLGDSRARDAQRKWHRSHRQTMLAPFDVVLNINVDVTLISAIAAASWFLNQWREKIFPCWAGPNGGFPIGKRPAGMGRRNRDSA